MSPLDGPEFFALMGLSRVRRGGVARCKGGYVDRSLPIRGYLLPEVLGVLQDQGLVTVAAPEPESGLARLTLTEAGEARHHELTRKQRGLPVVAPPERHARPGTACTFSTGPGAGRFPAGHRTSAAPPDAPVGDQPEPSPVAGPPAPRTRGNAEAYFEWLVLRHADGGGLTALSGRHFHQGRPVSADAATAIERLLDGGCLTLGTPSPAGRRSVGITVAGQVRLAELTGGGCD